MKLCIRMQLPAGPHMTPEDFSDYLAAQEAIASSTGFVGAVWDVDKARIQIYYQVEDTSQELLRGQRYVWVS